MSGQSQVVFFVGLQLFFASRGFCMGVSPWQNPEPHSFCLVSLSEYRVRQSITVSVRPGADPRWSLHLCEGERQSSVGKLHGYPGRFGKVDFESCGSSHDNWRWVMTSDVFFIFLMCFVQAQVAHSEVRMSEVLSRPKAWQCQCARAAWCCMAFDVGTDGYLGETAKQRNSEMAVDFCGLPWTRHSELAWFFDVLCRLWSLRKR